MSKATVAGLEMEFTAGHPAWACYEALTGRSIFDATQLLALFRAGVSLVHEFGWALSVRWRREHQPGMLYEAWVDLLPALGTPEWEALHLAISDEVGQAFYGRTWAELLGLLKVQADAIELVEA